MFRISLCKEDGIIQTEHLITTTFPWDFSAQRSRNQLYAFSTPRVSATMKAEEGKRRDAGDEGRREETWHSLQQLKWTKAKIQGRKKDESPS